MIQKRMTAERLMKEIQKGNLPHVPKHHNGPNTSIFIRLQDHAPIPVFTIQNYLMNNGFRMNASDEHVYVNATNWGPGHIFPKNQELAIFYMNEPDDKWFRSNHR